MNHAPRASLAALGKQLWVFSPKIAFVVATWKNSFVLSGVFCINSFRAHPRTCLPGITSPTSFPLSSLAPPALIWCRCHFVTMHVTLFPFFAGRLVILEAAAAILTPVVAPRAGCSAAGVLMAQTPHSVVLVDDGTCCTWGTPWDTRTSVTFVTFPVPAGGTSPHTDLLWLEVLGL